MFHIQVEDKLFGKDWLKCYGTKILDAKYEYSDVAEVVKGLTHLNAHQKADLLWVLWENKKMFDGTLGVYPHKKVHIDIDPNAKPAHSRPYPVPQIHLKSKQNLTIQLIQSRGRRLMAVAGEVTQHGLAHPYSWVVSIVSLKV